MLHGNECLENLMMSEVEISEEVHELETDVTETDTDVKFASEGGSTEGKR